MKNRTTLHRRFFIQSLTGLGTGLMFLSWYRLSQYQASKESRIEFKHGDDIAMGVSHFGSYYLYRNKEGVKAYSTKCTHAGCRIGKGKGGLLQCGCHGSQFDGSSGNPIKGPAILPLQQFDCQFDSDSRQWTVKIQSVSEHNAKSDQG